LKLKFDFDIDNSLICSVVNQTAWFMV